MSIYIFNLAVGFHFGGVERAQGYRAAALKECSYPVKFVFTQFPEKRELSFYQKAGIDIEQMLSAHHYFTDHPALALSVKAEDKLEELKESLHYTKTEDCGTEIWLIKDGCIVASLLLDDNNREYLYAIHYYAKGELIRTEYYTDGIVCVDYFVTESQDGGPYAKIVRRTFCHRDGSVAYDQLWKGEEEHYLFPDGSLYTRSQFIAEFVKRLSLSEKDIVFLDRGAQCDFVQPLFQFGNAARFMTFLHSGHYFEKGEDPGTCGYLNFNYEYLYFFKYSDKIDTMVVSTQRQKEELLQRLRDYGCAVPHVEVIPAAGIERLRHPKVTRERYSLLTVSRIDWRKKIDWIIKGVVKAHRKNPDIFIDIYGEGDRAHLKSLQDLVSEHQAQSYIRFMGYQDVTEVYQNYEVYLSASLWETLGLSMMEAVASGTAMIGLDVKYGNRLFIEPGRNGYLVDFNLNYVLGDDSRLIDDMAEKIVKIFEDEERLEEFHGASYEIAGRFSDEMIREKWRKLFGG